MLSKPLLALVSLGLLALAACGTGGTRTAGDVGLPPLAAPAAGNPVHKYIKHVVVIIQENRSFENFFAGYPGANAPMTGSAGGQTIALQPITFKGPDIRHDWAASIADWDNGNMDGFYQFGSSKYGQDVAYSYVEQSLIQPYWDMANQYVLADAMYPTEFGGSFTAHLTLVAGTDDLSPTKAEVDIPSGPPPQDCDSPPGAETSYVTPDRVVHGNKGPFPCFDQWKTMAQTLDHAGVSWKYYATQLVGAGMWEPFEAIKYVRDGPDWNKNIIVPQTQILTDPGNKQLASVTWVSPSVQDSDHPEAQSDQGPSWVSSVVNAVGQSSYWKSTAIVVLWDDWGGWYDNAPPPQPDFRGLGIRVPCLIISPYSREGQSSQGYVSHTQYEYGSILKFIEEAFNLPYLGSTANGYTDRRATSIDDSFDFTQKPRRFTPFGSKYGRPHFLREPPSHEPVDTE
ncbi:MAG TPA: alkaline phosphatase family protein [Candidatus Dormibacteraeota bacterium]|nr:alkaline phosphatase family protein [Candidatus Dormibacteraeota bacterium]